MEDIHDIKGPMELSFNYLPLIILFAILFLLLIFLIYLSLKKRKPKPQAEDNAPVEIKLTPRDIALIELEKIKKERLIELKKTDIFYNRLTEILKRYLTEQYNLEVFSKTSTEILTRLKSLQFNYDFVRQIELCIKDLDFAKYSNYNKSTKDMTESFDLISGLFKLEVKIHNQPGEGKFNLKP